MLAPWRRQTRWWYVAFGCLGVKITTHNNNRCGGRDVHGPSSQAGQPGRDVDVIRPDEGGRTTRPARHRTARLVRVVGGVDVSG